MSFSLRCLDARWAKASKCLLCFFCCRLVGMPGFPKNIQIHRAGHILCNVEMTTCSEKYMWDSWKTSVSVWCLELEIYYSLMKWYSIFNWDFYHGSPPILTINLLLNTPNYLRSSKFGCLKVASFEIAKSKRQPRNLESFICIGAKCFLSPNPKKIGGSNLDHAKQQNRHDYPVHVLRYDSWWLDLPYQLK